MKKLGIAVVLFLAGLGTAALGADFNGDGTGDIAIFRASSGLWSVRGLTRIYFGGSGDSVVPGDYSGSGADQPAIFRKVSGLWAIRGVTRIYFGGSSDEAMPGDYNGDGMFDAGIFRASAGLWAVKGITRVYYGNSTDTAISPGKGKTGGGLLKTGQTTSYRTGDDAYYGKGNAYDYSDNGNGTVTDRVTGLVWAKDGNGEGCNYGGGLTWSAAIDWAEGLDFAGRTDWRLPNVKELSSLANYGRVNPAIDPAYFPNTKGSKYWSSTTVATVPSYAACVNFDYGDGAGYPKEINTYYVRAVCGGK